tara:strand:+ start:371 stop:541 length:171 start_codon:yes stop_codon:yes gene_type:complete
LSTAGADTAEEETTLLLKVNRYRLWLFDSETAGVAEEGKTQLHRPTVMKDPVIILL